MRQVTLVAHDIGGCNGLNLLGDYLEAQGVKVFRYLKGGDPTGTSFAMEEQIASSDAVVCGMSSSKVLATIELVAADMAKQAGVPFFLFADAFKSHLKPYFQDLLLEAAAFMVLSPTEAQKARDRFPGINAVATGNPAWEKFFFPRFSREEVRDRLMIPEDKFVVLSPGTKDLVINVLLWGSILDAVEPLDNVLVLASVHPRDKSPIKEYEKLADWSTDRLQVVVSDPNDPESMSGSNILPGANVVIDSGSTIALEAAALRIPVLTYSSEISLGRRQKDNGTRLVEMAKLGLTNQRHGVRAVHDLGCEVRSVYYRKLNAVKRRQEEVFPQAEEPDQAVKKMVAVLESVVCSREA